MTNSHDFDGPLPVLISARVRLDADQRNTLKTAYAALRNPVAAKPTLSGSLTVETQYGTHSIDQQVGMSQLTFCDLVNSRETVSLPVILELQRNLGVSVVTKEHIQQAAENYTEYVFNKFA